MNIHVVPENDGYPHATTGTACPCIPRIEDYGCNAVVIHNAWDHREAREKQAMQSTGGRA